MERKFTIRQLRRSRDLTQQALAEMVGLSGAPHISNYEKEKVVPSGPTLQKLARALGVDANEIDLSYADREAAA